MSHDYPHDIYDDGPVDYLDDPVFEGRGLFDRIHRLKRM